MYITKHKIELIKQKISKLSDINYEKHLTNMLLTDILMHPQKIIFDLKVSKKPIFSYQNKSYRCYSHISKLGITDLFLKDMLQRDYLFKEYINNVIDMLNVLFKEKRIAIYSIFLNLNHSDSMHQLAIKYAIL